ncbi:hypothetical protein NW767_013171 [Fusarium falciforme]|nr:hypothetical protein NW767_013171 [Fusarium falciforme]
MLAGVADVLTLQATGYGPLALNLPRRSYHVNLADSASGCTYEYQRKKPGLKGGAVEALSRRVEMLENAVFNNPHAPMTVPPSAGQPETLHSHAESGDPQALGGILSILTREIQQLNSNLATPSTRAGPIATPSASSIHGSAQEEEPDSTTERPRKRTRLNSFALIDEAENNGVAHRRALSRPDVIEELLDAYFENIHPWVPILHETRFRHRLADSKHRDQSFIILHAILVAALRLVDVTKPCVSILDIDMEERRSRNYVLLNGMSDLTLENLQALVIIAFIDIGQGETSKAWSTIGSLARTAQYLHLSVEDTDFAEPAALLSNLPRLPPPENWIEEEERRRLFWNVFLLDSWNVSLTADDVCRRLPIDGGLWKRNQPALTPYLGIWDHSAAKIGHTITFLPSKYEIPGSAAESGTAAGSGATNESGPHQGNSAASVERLKIGAFAYYVESVESLSRINTYFVQQKIDFTNRQEVFSWLTRFKELDLRLVHWKMFLPQKWKNPSDNPIPAITTAMDPNMTLAHLTHNMSSILLHQRIAYPSKELRHLKLPNACSADTCYVAATETANITTKYLDHAVTRRVLAPHFAICVFVSAKVLLVHSLHYEVELASEFWTLVESLESMSSKWKGRSGNSRNEPVPLAGSLATQLRQLHDLCQKDVANSPPSFFGQVPQGLGNEASAMQAVETPVRFHRAADGNGDHGDAPLVSGGPVVGEATPYWEPMMLTVQGDETSQLDKPPSTIEVSKDSDQSLSVQGHLQAPAIEAAAVDELALISQGLMDRSFLEMNRIINFDDFMFITDPVDFSGVTGL